MWGTNINRKWFVIFLLFWSPSVGGDQIWWWPKWFWLPYDGRDRIFIRPCLLFFILSSPLVFKIIFWLLTWFFCFSLFIFSFFPFVFCSHPPIFLFFHLALFFHTLFNLANIFPFFLLLFSPFIFHFFPPSSYFIAISCPSFPWFFRQLKNSVNIQHTHTIGWQLKFFSHLRCKMGNDFFFPNLITHAPPLSVTIWWWGYTRWQLKNFDHLERGGEHVISFLKKNHLPPPPKCPFEWMKNFSCHSMVGVCQIVTEFYGDQKNWVAIQHTPIV